MIVSEEDAGDERGTVSALDTKAEYDSDKSGGSRSAMSEGGDRMLLRRVRGAPPTTGEYVRVGAARKKYLDMLRQEWELEREKQFAACLPEELLKDSKMDLDKAIEKAKLNPSVNLASRAREVFKDVLHVAKMSSNMQGK